MGKERQYSFWLLLWQIFLIAIFIAPGWLIYKATGKIAISLILGFLVGCFVWVILTYFIGFVTGNLPLSPSSHNSSSLLSEDEARQQLLLIMKYDRRNVKFRKIQELFDNYPQYNLSSWEPYLEWYQELLDTSCNQPSPDDNVSDADVESEDTLPGNTSGKLRMEEKALLKRKLRQ